MWNCTWNTPRCVKFREIALKWSAYVFVVFLAMLIGWIFYPNYAGETRWANIQDIHAYWDHDADKLQLSVVLKKNENCRRVVVDKSLRPIVGNDVIGTNSIPVNGKLSEKMLAAPLGTSTLFDLARVRAGITPHGQYLLTIVATCEQSVGKSEAFRSVRTAPADVIVVVHNPPHTWMAKVDPRFA